MCSFIFSYSQTEKVTLKKFGLGIHVEQFKLSNINNDVDYLSPNKIIFTFNFRNFRLEPEIGYRTATDNNSKDKVSAFGFAIGFMGMSQHGRLNFPIGVRIKDDIFTEKSATSNFNGNPTEFKETTTVLSAGPVVGAEYFLGDNFSIAGEIGLMFSAISSKHDEAFNGPETDISEFNTDTGLLVRFYF
jgi:hypothetical protein